MNKEDAKIRLIAYYLPQFHPTPENDEWWGKGFTDWTNVGRAKPLFKGHNQPRVPADLGYYDLRIPEVQIAQSEMAMEYGIEAFCYWHYWFGNGKSILEMPVKRHLLNNDIKISFCIGWANYSWSGIWQGEGNRILIKQTYPGKQDYINHFNAVKDYFIDERYFKVNGKPLVVIYSPNELPSANDFIEIWQKQAKLIGFSGLHIVAYCEKFEDINKYIEMGFDAVNLVRLMDILRLNRAKIQTIKIKLWNKINQRPTVFYYKEALPFLQGAEDAFDYCIPTIIPNWDHSPRTGNRVMILHNSTPELFRKHVNSVFGLIKNKEPEKRIAIIKSWNEWAEGNYIEPDIVHGRRYLEVLKESLQSYYE